MSVYRMGKRPYHQFLPSNRGLTSQIYSQVTRYQKKHSIMSNLQMIILCMFKSHFNLSFLKESGNCEVEISMMNLIILAFF